MSGGLILTAYALLIWQAGWWGLAAVVAHVTIMLLAIPRKPRPKGGVPVGIEDDE